MAQQLRFNTYDQAMGYYREQRRLGWAVSHPHQPGERFNGTKWVTDHSWYVTRLDHA
jgi:hypothetical protein